MSKKNYIFEQRFVYFFAISTFLVVLLPTAQICDYFC